MVSFLSKEQVNGLFEISDRKEFDYHFVRKLVAYLYAGDESAKLPYRSLTGIHEGIIRRNGKQYFRSEKKPVTPEKRLVIQRMMKSRINRADLSPDEKYARTTQVYINTLLKGSLCNLRVQHDRMEVNVEK